MKQNLITSLIFLLFCFCGLQAQTISADPDSGFINETFEALTVNISGVGTQFQSGTTTCGPLTGNSVVFKQGSSMLYLPVIDVVSEELITVEMLLPSFISPPGDYDIIIWENAGPGCEVSCEGCFEVLDPTAGNISELDVTMAGLGEELKVTISGENSYWSQASPCSIDAGNVIFSQGSSTIFTPDNVVILDIDTLCAFITVPSDIDIGFFDVTVGAGSGCETTCEDCFEVTPIPEIEFTTPPQGGQGQQPQFSMRAASGEFTNCEFTTDNVFLQLGSNIIYPISVEIIDDELIATFDIPENAVIGNYNVVVGDGLDYDCNFICENCYLVTAPPEIILPNDTDAEQGEPVNLSINLTTGTYDECELTTENVFLVLGDDVIYPTAVEIIDNELLTTFDIPEDAAVGDYDLIVGEGLDEYGCSFECVSCFTVNEFVGIDPIFNAALSLYPNPFDNQIHIKSEMILHNVNLQLYDAMGQLVFERQWLQMQSEVIDIIDLPKGIYIFKILAEEGETYKRVLHH